MFDNFTYVDHLWIGAMVFVSMISFSFLVFQVAQMVIAEFGLTKKARAPKRVEPDTKKGDKSKADKKIFGVTVTGSAAGQLQDQQRGTRSRESAKRK
jgi:hypothetical protein